MKCNGSMYNLYNKNKTNDLVGQQQSEVMDFYIPIGAVLLQLQDCPNNLAGIESNNIHVWFLLSHFILLDFVKSTTRIPAQSISFIRFLYTWDRICFIA